MKAEEFRAPQWFRKEKTSPRAWAQAQGSWLWTSVNKTRHLNDLIRTQVTCRVGALHHEFSNDTDQVGKKYWNPLHPSWAKSAAFALCLFGQGFASLPLSCHLSESSRMVVISIPRRYLSSCLLMYVSRQLSQTASLLSKRSSSSLVLYHLQCPWNSKTSSSPNPWHSGWATSY
jgi:hypothetical protein